jgi:hypothetical protein
MSRILLGVMELQEAKRVRSHLEERGVRLELVSNPETCGDGKVGCKPSVEVYAQEADVPLIAEFFKREKERDLGGREIDPQLLSQVFDTSNEDATCPACGTQFKTAAKECPDCGLVFVPEGMEPAGEGE